MSSRIRWGILGTGSIARKFAEGLAVLPDAELAAVGSRAAETADAFGDRFGVARRHASYEALAQDPDVDAIYVATPHVFHRENSLLCLGAGKAVLCEKPFTIHAGEAREVVAFARQRGVFLMEAMWTRFLPVMGRVRDWVGQGAIGEVRMVSADFGFRAGVNPKGRLFDLRLGGGGLLDVGVYTVSFASMIFGGPPEAVASEAHIGETGADEQVGMVLKYAGGGLALLACAVRTRTLQDAVILGTEGSIRVHPPFWRGSGATLSAGGKEESVTLAYEGNGYNCEAAHVMACLREGRTESGVMPLDETVAVMETLDRIRAQWGLRYPGE